MKRRVLSWMLTACMLLSLLPGTLVLPVRAAENGASGKDAFGLSTEVKPNVTAGEELRNNPYGTLGWVPLFLKQELVVSGVDSDQFQTTYEKEVKKTTTTETTEVGTTQVTVETSEGGKGSQLSTFRWDNDTSSTAVKRIATVAFDADGTGRDEYIGTVVFDTKANRLKLYVTTKDKIVSNTVELGGADAWFLKSLKFYQVRAMLSITAGDYDGDGKDTLLVYVPGGNTYGSHPFQSDYIAEYRLAGGKTLSATGRTIELGDIIEGGMPAHQAMLEKHTSNDGNELRSHLSVDMTSGDVDRDGMDELAMTVNVSELKDDTYSYNNKSYTNLERSYLTVYDGDGDEWAQAKKWELTGEDGGAKGRARHAGVGIGNISTVSPTNTTAPEVFAIGYYDKADNCNKRSLDTGTLVLYSYRWTASGWVTEIERMQLTANEFTKVGTKSDSVQQPIATAAVSADGALTQEYIFASGSMYKIGQTENGNQNKLKILDGTTKGKNRGITKGANSYVINNTGILDYAVGNFDGNKAGREQVVYVEYHKQETFDKQFLRLGGLYKETNGESGSETNAQQYTSGGNFKSWADGWTYFARGNCGLAVTAADVNKDAVLAKIEEISYGHTDPSILAILESTPYFAEVNGGDTGESATSIGYVKSTETKEGTSGSFGFDTMIGYEYVAPVVETGGGFEVNNSWTFAFGNYTQTERDVEISYSNNTGDHAVVMHSTPMTYYKFRVQNPEGSDTEYGTMMMAVAGDPQTNMVSLDTYNAAAEEYGLTPIGDGVLGTPGKPATYRSNLPNAGSKNSWQYTENDKGDVTTGWKSYNKSDGFTTQNITTATGHVDTFDYEFAMEISGYGIVGGFKVGGGVHWSVGTSTEKVNMNGVRKEGTVNGVQNEDYNFEWKFASWTINLDGNDVPVLGYLIRNVVAPPSPAQDLTISDQTTDSMLLSWTEGDDPADYYDIYLCTQEGTGEKYILVDTVSAANASGVYHYQFSGLSPNTEYRFALVSGSVSSGLESVYSEVVLGKTLATELERPTIIPGWTGDTISSQVGDTAKLSVAVTLPTGAYRNATFQWQERLAGGRWTDIAGADKREYTLPVTQERDGASYRCVVKALTTGYQEIPFYSDSVKLTAGTPAAKAGLTVSGIIAGEGTTDSPYLGRPNHDVVTAGTPSTVTTQIPYTVSHTVSEKAVTLRVYNVGTENAPNYVGLGETAEGEEVYYALQGSESNGKLSFAVGEELTLETVMTLKDGETSVTLPDGTDAASALTTTLGTGESAATYAQMVRVAEGALTGGFLSLDGICNASGTVITDANEDEYYYLHSPLTVEENGTMLLSRMVKNAGNEDGEETLTYYLAKVGASSAVTLTTLTVKETTRLSGAAEDTTFTAVESPAFAVVNETKQETVTPEVRTATPGTELTMQIKTVRQDNGAALGAMPYVISITNTSTGTVTTLSGTTDANGTATQTWTAPVSGMYCITASMVGGTESTTVYYLAGVQEQKTGRMTEDVYMLSGNTRVTYGETVNLTARKKTVSVAANGTLTAGGDDAAQGVTYKYRSAASTAETVIAQGSAFVPPYAGSFIVTAYDGSGKKLAATTVTVDRAPLRVYPDWTGADKMEPAAQLSEIKPKAEGLLGADSLPDGAFTVACGLYQKDGTLNTALGGRYEVALSLESAKAADLLKKYAVTLESRVVFRALDTYIVAFASGTNGSLGARYGESLQQFTSGESIAVGESLQFDASPNSGYKVKCWKVNGTEVTENERYRISNDGKMLTIKGFAASDVGTDSRLLVEVEFANAAHSVTFAVSGANGGLTAKADAETLTTGQNVADGASVTFTAQPDDGYAVAVWTVNGKAYCWPGTSDAYREKTLEISEIDAPLTVQVSFETAKPTHKVTAEVTAEGAANTQGITIEAKLADGTPAALTAVADGAAITFTVKGLTANTVLREWRVNGTAAEGSGGKESFTVYNVTADTTVTAVISVMQSYKLSWKAAMPTAGEEVPAAADVEFTVTANGKRVESGDSLAAYSSVNFAVTLNGDYEAVAWSNAKCAETDETKQTALLSSLTADTEVVVTIREKPKVKVTFSATEDSEGSLAAKSGGTELQGSEMLHYRTEVTFTAAAEDGFRVKEWRVNGEVWESAGTDTSVTLTLTEEMAAAGAHVTVQFMPLGNEVTFRVAENGSIERVEVGGQSYDFATGLTLAEGAEVVITAQPNVGYEVAAWKLNGTVIDGAQGSTYTYTASGTVGAEIGVSFQPVRYTVRWSAENGIVTAAGQSGTSASIRGGESVLFTAVPADGCTFSGWTVNGEPCGADDMTLNWQVPTGEAAGTAYAVRAVFARENRTYTITYGVNDAAGGSVAVNGKSSPLTVKSGGSVTFAASPAAGYMIREWRVDGTAVNGTANQKSYTLENVMNHHSVTVVFQAAVLYQVGYAADGADGTLAATVDGAALTLESGQTKPVAAGAKLEFTAKSAKTGENDATMIARWTVFQGAGDTTGTIVTAENMRELGVTMTHPLASTLTVDSLKSNVTVKVTFEAYEGFAIPGGTGYTVTSIAGTPTTAPATQVRRGGDVTFTVKPDAENGYTTLGGLIVNGYDCIAGKLADEAQPVTNCSAVTAQVNADGSCTVTIRNVSAAPELNVTAHKVQVSGLDGNYTPPQSIVNAGYADAAAVQTALNAKLSGTKDGTAYYDITLMYYDASTNTWLPVSAENFPKGGVLVLLPYPEGADRNDRFKIVHMRAEDGKIEEIKKFTREEGGLSFRAASLSPFAVSWTEYTAPAVGGGGGGGAMVAEETVIVADAANGTVRVSDTAAKAGDTVTVTVVPERGYTIETITVTDETGAALVLSGASGTYRFTMPNGTVTVTAVFMEDNTMLNFFVDVPASAYYYDAVLWAVQNGITDGTDAVYFTPGGFCTRAQLVTFLYRAAGSPAAEGTVHFADVHEGAYYADAVRWAAGMGIVKGYDNGLFGGGDLITREQVAAILFRYAAAQGQNTDAGADADVLEYRDAQSIAAYALPAIRWAVGTGVMQGADGMLMPKENCTRAQIVTMLCRSLTEKGKAQ